MKLIIAEKPSVAGEIARVVGATKNEKGYKSGNNYLVSWCVGHLIELSPPEAYSETYKTWNLEDLPIIPSAYRTMVSPGTRDQFEIVKELMHRADVDELIEATDAGREGELIFRLVYEQAGCTKPFSRLWISSMEEKSIRDGLASVRPSSDYDSLYYAARCRQRADWVYGMNLTRLYTKLYPNAGTLNCGRVQTPTVNLIVQRAKDIKDFKPTTYYNLIAELASDDLHFEARTRADSSERAEELIRLCAGRTGTVTAITEENKTENPPALYDLTTLQRDANRLLGYSAQQTLDLVQALYEKKLSTYPRTDSRYLTTDMTGSTKILIDGLQDNGFFEVLNLKNYDVNSIHVENVINDGKVSDHHALLPTMLLTPEAYQQLPTAEKNVLALITGRLLTAVYAPYRYTTTKVALDIEGVTFDAAGKTVLDAGFRNIVNCMKAFLKKGAEEQDKEQILPALQEGGQYTAKAVRKEEKKTQPPKPYTEDTLLAAMETCGKDIEDEAFRAAMKDRGLGSPATRAGIIENIIKTGYIIRDGNKLLPTDKADQFMDIVVDQIKQPDLTAEWEYQLSEIQRGELTEADFMNGINDFIRQFTKSCLTALQNGELKAAFTERRSQQPSLGACPNCGGDVVKGKFGAFCSQKCGMNVSRIMGAELSDSQIKNLLAGKKILLKGLTSKKGGTYDVYLIPDGVEPYSYVKADGTTVSGHQFKFKKEFPKKEK